MLYGLYPYVLDRLDSLLDTSCCAGMSLSQCNGQWRGECHIIDGLQVKTIVLSVVADTSGWEKHVVENIVSVLACLQKRAEIKSVAVEGELLVGRSVAAALVSDTPLVVGMVTANTVFQELQRQFLAEFGGLDPLSVLEYFKVRLLSVVRERFMDRVPQLRQVREKETSCFASLSFVFVLCVVVV